MSNDKLNIHNMGRIIHLMKETHKVIVSEDSKTKQIEDVANQLSNYLNTKTINVIIQSLRHLGLNETIKRYILSCGEEVTKDD